MKFSYKEILHAAGQLLAEGGSEYQRPDLKRLLAISLRLVVEIMIGLHVMRKEKQIDEEAYKKLYEQCEDLRKLIVRLKDYV